MGHHDGASCVQVSASSQDWLPIQAPQLACSAADVSAATCAPRWLCSARSTCRADRGGGRADRGHAVAGQPQLQGVCTVTALFLRPLLQPHGARSTSELSELRCNLPHLLLVVGGGEVLEQQAVELGPRRLHRLGGVAEQLLGQRQQLGEELQHHRLQIEERWARLAAGWWWKGDAIKGISCGNRVARRHLYQTVSSDQYTPVAARRRPHHAAYPPQPQRAPRGRQWRAAST